MSTKPRRYLQCLVCGAPLTSGYKFCAACAALRRAHPSQVALRLQSPVKLEQVRDLPTILAILHQIAPDPALEVPVEAVEDAPILAYTYQPAVERAETVIARRQRNYAILDDCLRRAKERQRIRQAQPEVA